MSPGNLYIGTSGWHYSDWKGPFYPRDTATKDMLPYYAGYFHTVEINNSFYRLPQEKVLRQWKNAVPEDFVFSVKASRYITHMKKLKDPQEPLANFLQRMEALGDKLGPVLFQLPPRWKLNLERLNEFLDILPDDRRCTFEFRDDSWFDEQVYRALSRHNAAFCIYDLDRRLSPKKVTADFVYIRLHGPDGPYQGEYDTGTLSGWAGAFSTWRGKGWDVYCYFDNDQRGYAARNALRLKGMLAE